MRLMSLRYVASDAEGVRWFPEYGFPHLLFDLCLFSWIGQHKSLGGIDVFVAGPVTALASHHREILLGSGNETARLSETSDMALQASGIGLILFWKIRKCGRVLCFRPGVRLRPMTLEALIRARELRARRLTFAANSL
jgi:hypothetical protein